MANVAGNVMAALAALDHEMQTSIDKVLKQHWGLTSDVLRTQETRNGVMYYTVGSHPRLAAELVHQPGRTHYQNKKTKGGIIKTKTRSEPLDQVFIYDGKGHKAAVLTIGTLDRDALRKQFGADPSHWICEEIDKALGIPIRTPEEEERIRKKRAASLEPEKQEGASARYVKSITYYYAPEMRVVQNRAHTSEKSTDDHKRARSLERHRGSLNKIILKSGLYGDRVHQLLEEVAKLPKGEESAKAESKAATEASEEVAKKENANSMRSRQRVRMKIQLNPPKIEMFKPQSVEQFSFKSRIKNERHNDRDGSYQIKQVDNAGGMLVRKFDERGNQVYQAKYDKDGALEKENHKRIARPLKKPKRQPPSDNAIRNRRLERVDERELHEDLQSVLMLLDEVHGDGEKKNAEQHRARVEALRLRAGEYIRKTEDIRMLLNTMVAHVAETDPAAAETMRESMKAFAETNRSARETLNGIHAAQLPARSRKKEEWERHKTPDSPPAEPNIARAALLEEDPVLQIVMEIMRDRERVEHEAGLREIIQTSKEGWRIGGAKEMLKRSPGKSRLTAMVEAERDSQPDQWIGQALARSILDRHAQEQEEAKQQKTTESSAKAAKKTRDMQATFARALSGSDEPSEYEIVNRQLDESRARIRQELRETGMISEEAHDAHRAALRAEEDWSWKMRDLYRRARDEFETRGKFSASIQDEFMQLRGSLLGLLPGSLVRDLRTR